MFGPERVTELPYASPFPCPAESVTPSWRPQSPLSFVEPFMVHKNL